MSESATERTLRDDFQATSDPGVLESADRGEVNLLSYEQLYELWERQQWATQDIDFTQDRIDWHERIPSSTASTGRSAFSRPTRSRAASPRRAST